MQNFNFDNVVMEGVGTIYTCTDNGAPVRPDPEEEIYLIQSYNFVYGADVNEEKDLSVWDAVSLDVTVAGTIDAGDSFYVYNSAGAQQRLYTDEVISETFNIAGNLISGKLVTGPSGTGTDVALSVVDPAPSGEPEPPTYDIPDPEMLYFWEYRTSIIVSCSITNNNIKAVKATVSITKDDPVATIPVVYDIEIPAGGTMVVIGGNHKVFLEHTDAIEISLKNAIDDNLVVSTTSVMNIYDFGHIPPVWRDLLFFGDIGAFGNGASNNRVIDKIFFASDTITKNFATIGRYYLGKAAGSNSITSLWGGGYSSYSYIEEMPFATFAFNSSWGTLYDGTGYCAGASDGITFVIAGGYSRQNVIQANLFASGGAGSYWGNLNQGGKQYLMSVNNLTYALWMGGYYTNNTISSSEMKSSGSSTFWGNLYGGQDQYHGMATSNDIMGLSHGDYNSSYTKTVHKYMFDTQGDSTNFGTLGGISYALYDGGAIGNSQKALFGGDERLSDDWYEVDFAAEFHSAHWGKGTYMDGGFPTGSSGN